MQSNNNKLISLMRVINLMMLMIFFVVLWRL